MLEQGKTYRPNRHPGTCPNCGNRVEAEAGLLVRGEGQWHVVHRGECPPPVVRRNMRAQNCEMCGRNVPAGEGALERSDSGGWAVFHIGGCATEFPFPDGRYAIETDEGVRFYHCADGQVFVMASDNEILIQPHAAKAIVERIALDSLAAAKLYGIEFEQCGVCGRGLTSEWRKVGIGPVCAQKGWG